MLGWLSHSEDRPDVKINVICPATEVHIRKVNPLRLMMASESKS
jgi:m7GpppX diphosphatase